MNGGDDGECNQTHPMTTERLGVVLVSRLVRVRSVVETSESETRYPRGGEGQHHTQCDRLAKKLSGGI